MVLPPNVADLLEGLKEKYTNFNDWRVETIDDKCLVYSSKTAKEIMESNAFKNHISELSQKNQLRTTITDVVKQIKVNNKMIAT